MNNLKAEMEFKKGQIIPNICCPSYGFELAVKIADWLGVCLNPDCPEGRGTIYQHIRSFAEGDLVEALSEAGEMQWEYQI